MKRRKEVGAAGFRRCWRDPALGIVMWFAITIMRENEPTSSTGSVVLRRDRGSKRAREDLHECWERTGQSKQRCVRLAFFRFSWTGFNIVRKQWWKFLRREMFWLHNRNKSLPFQLFQFWINGLPNHFHFMINVICHYLNYSLWFSRYYVNVSCPQSVVPIFLLDRFCEKTIISENLPGNKIN